MADTLRKILMAGFGAIATAVEKTAGALNEAAKKENTDRIKTTVDDLARKGETAYEKSKAAGSEVFGKIGDAISGLGSVEVDDIKKRLGDLADDALDEVERAIGEIKRLRSKQGESDSAQPADSSEKPGAPTDSGGEQHSETPQKPKAKAARRSDNSADQPEPHIESGEKLEGAEEEFLRRTNSTTSRSDGEDFSEGMDDDV
jgi:polyhydroxyalkanoate synthesis regulator phasin